MYFYELHPLLSTWISALEARLASLFQDERAVIHDAGLTVVGSHGKRLRPVLLLLSCACFHEVTDRALDNAALVELIHTASLAHDDVIDDAASRRGSPSAPARWGNKFSILLGDYMLARVFQLATQDGDPEILRLLATTATEMGRAVILELSVLGIDATEATYWQVTHGKTAELFAASAAIGAIVGGATPAQQQAMYAMGAAFGRAYQLADDMLDLQGCEQHAGKPLGVDWHQRRATLPLIYALKQAPAPVAAEMRALWQQVPFSTDQLTTLRELVTAAGGFEYGWRTVNEYRERACAYLDDMPAGDGREALRRCCHDMFPLPVMPAAV